MNPFDDPTHDREVGQRNSTRDTTRIDDTRIEAVRPLITPALLMEKLPGSQATLALVERSREAIARVLHGQDDRLIVVVGPCSIHDHAQALEYAALLKAAAEPLADALLVVMRTYFEKPRTTLGWKGYINDPHLDGTFAVNEGLERARLPASSSRRRPAAPATMRHRRRTCGEMANSAMRVRPGDAPTAGPAAAPAASSPARRRRPAR